MLESQVIMVLTRQRMQALKKVQLYVQMQKGSLLQQNSECATFKALNIPLVRLPWYYTLHALTM